MLKGKHLTGMPVVDLAAGKEIGRVQQLLVDAPEKRVAGLVVAPGRWPRDARVLAWVDVHAVGDHAVTVADGTSVVRLSQAPHLQKLLKEHQRLYGARVLTESGHLLGVVEEFFIDPTTGRLMELQLSTAGGLAGLRRNRPSLPIRYIRSLGGDVVVARPEASRHLERMRAGAPQEDGATEEGSGPDPGGSAQGSAGGSVSGTFAPGHPPQDRTSDIPSLPASPPPAGGPPLPAGPPPRADLFERAAPGGPEPRPSLRASTAEQPGTYPSASSSASPDPSSGTSPGPGGGNRPNGAGSKVANGANGTAGAHRTLEAAPPQAPDSSSGGNAGLTEPTSPPSHRSDPSASPPSQRMEERLEANLRQAVAMARDRLHGLGEGLRDGLRRQADRLRQAIDSRRRPGPPAS